MPSTYTFLQTATSGTGETSITFSNISQDYTDLILVSNMAFTASGKDFRLYVGNETIDETASYSAIYTAMSSGSPSSSFLTDSYYIAGYRLLGGGTNWQNSIYQIQNYSNPSVFKNILLRVNDASAEVLAGIAVWRSLSAIKTLTLWTNGVLVSGSTFNLYGIKAA